MLKKQPKNKNSSWSYYEIFEENTCVGSFSIYFSGKNPSLWSFRIYENYQNKGYGSKALKEIIISLKKKKFKTFDLFVMSVNIGAIRLYNRVGFRIIKNNDNITYLMSISL